MFRVDMKIMIVNPGYRKPKGTTLPT
jgi:hypothetical protein